MFDHIPTVNLQAPRLTNKSFYGTLIMDF